MPDTSFILSIDTTAKDFLERSSDFLYRREDLYSHILSLAIASTERQCPFSAPFWFATVLDNYGEIAACAVHANPDGLICTVIDDEKAARLIASEFQTALGFPHRISGPPETVRLLKTFFDAAKRQDLSKQKTWTIYRIDDAPKSPASFVGNLKVGTKSDEELVRAWGQLYDLEKPAFTSIEEFLVRKLTRKELFMWVHNDTKSIVTLSGKTKRGVRISALYTPPEFRGQGFATSAISTLVGKAIANGASFVTLHAQHGDAVENFYTKIGFKPIGKYFSIYR
jgi:GNAT superfamily N-acetyltransferase